MITVVVGLMHECQVLETIIGNVMTKNYDCNLFTSFLMNSNGQFQNAMIQTRQLKINLQTNIHITFMSYYFRYKLPIVPIFFSFYLWVIIYLYIAVNKVGLWMIMIIMILFLLKLNFLYVNALDIINSSQVSFALPVLPTMNFYNRE